MRQGYYEGTVQSMDVNTGNVTCIIPSLFGNQPQVLAPALARGTDVSRIAPVKGGERVLCFSPGSDDSAMLWEPTVRDAAFDSYYTSFFDARYTAFFDARYDARYTAQFVDIVGDTMTGRLNMNAGASTEALRFISSGAYMTFYNAGQTTRTGYIQGNDSSGITFASEAGVMNLNGPDGSKLTFGSLNLGIPTAYGSSYRGLNYGSQYIIMTDGGGETYVTCGSGAGVHIRSNANGTYSLDINASGTHVMTGHLNHNGYDNFGIGTNVASAYRWSGSGYVVTHNSDTDTGIYYDSDGAWRLMANGSTVAQIQANEFTVGAGNRIELYSPGNNTNKLEWNNATPPGSGEANNGPMLQGYSSVWLHTAVGGNLFLSSAGYVFINAGNTYTNFSSRTIKKNIVSLDPEQCLDEVRRWRPVQFDYVGSGKHDEGFISEEMFEVTPAVVHVTGPDDAVPNHPNAIAYGQLTTKLGGAVQALLSRVEILEAQLSGR